MTPVRIIKQIWRLISWINYKPEKGLQIFVWIIAFVSPTANHQISVKCVTASGESRYNIAK